MQAEFATPWRLPGNASLDNFYLLLVNTSFLRWLGNSLVIALGVVWRSEHWALNAAEDMIKEDERAYGKLIEKKRAKDRGIYVDGVAAFVQKERYSKGGDFVGVFGDLKLP